MCRRMIFIASLRAKVSSSFVSSFKRTLGENPQTIHMLWM